jgi:hypothetical protein
MKGESRRIDMEGCGREMARTPVLRTARRIAALGVTLTITAAALLIPGAGVASANAGNPPNIFVLTPSSSIPGWVPCGTVAEFTVPHGFQFPVAETPEVLAAFRLPATWAPSIASQLKLLGSYFGSWTIPTPSCGASGSSGSGGTVNE